MSVNKALIFNLGLLCTSILLLTFAQDLQKLVPLCVADLLEDGFGEHPFYQCILAEWQEEQRNEGTNLLCILQRS